tara:strand:- start:75 stop:359 length:285 start_codon:yes stop_codon:yes gene_type:complete
MKKLFIGLSFLIPFQLLTATPEVNADKITSYENNCISGLGIDPEKPKTWNRIVAYQFFEEPGRAARRCRNHTRKHGQDHDVYGFYEKFSSDPRF